MHENSRPMRGKVRFLPDSDSYSSMWRVFYGSAVIKPETVEMNGERRENTSPSTKGTS
ncbi:hypothetical protein BN2476_940043 [Paraburkholderia piptadeniae]|uniref:Uncharacterized protein n=1 Tax=Paraburkholderia piptadeniae TaxID=1701573 RepID=A0A1N7SU05_9BURK|nr:hypothetical protein BN2476_940043 [Paraburkholderia piptadeniae]